MSEHVRWTPAIDLGSAERFGSGGLAAGMILRIVGLSGEDYTVRVAKVVPNKDGTVTVTTEPIDGPSPDLYTLDLP